MMQSPNMNAARRVAPDTEILSADLPIPGLGILQANAFLIRSKQPVLVDTGVVALEGAFLERLAATIDLADIRWIWLTHTDADHIGALEAVLRAAPQCRLVTTFLGMGKLGLSRPVAPERVFLLNPGQSLDVGDRQLAAVKPPTFDAPETVGLFDGKTRVLFSADAFGGLLERPAEDARQVTPAELRRGVTTWTSVDSPWLSLVPEPRLDSILEELMRLGPETILSSHLPPAHDMNAALIEALRAARTQPPFVGPDQAAMMKMMAAA